MLNPYEFFCWAKKSFPKDRYANDFYSDKGGEWSNYYHKQKLKKKNPKKKKVKLTVTS